MRAFDNLASIQTSALALAISVIVGLFIFLVDMQTLEGGEDKPRSVLARGLLVVGGTAASALVSRMLPFSWVLFFGFLGVLVNAPSRYNQVFRLKIAWALVVGVIIGSGLFSLAVPFSALFGCFILLYAKDERCH